jgi:4-hydroxythreonine-4-phosphate dehydrogenase
MKTTADRLVIALGDPAGIGAEVTLKALARPRPAGQEVVLVGCGRWLQDCHRQLLARSDAPLADPDAFPLVDIPLEQPVVPGVSSPAAGAASFAWLSEAVAPAPPG